MSTFSPPSPLLTVSAPPHAHCGRTTRGLMAETLFALAPAAIMAVLVFGLPALRVMALSCAVAVICETLCARAMAGTPAVDDLNALVIGLLFAFLLPASAPWWLVAAGSATSVVLGKMVFGGLGGSPLCAPLVGWAVCKLSWKGAMDYDLSMLSSSLTSPLAQLKHLGPQAVAGISLQDLLLGQQLGGLGAVQVAALLAGGAYLLIRGRLRPHIPLAFLAGTFLTALIYFYLDPAACAPPLFHLLAGGAVLGAFFLAPDCSSSPVGHVPMIVFGLLAGCLVVVIRVYGVYPDGVPFAILLAELLTPLVDRIRPRPLGVG